MTTNEAFASCSTGHPDDHWRLNPVCHARTMVGPHWRDRDDPPICGIPLGDYPHNNYGEEAHKAGLDDGRWHEFVDPRGQGIPLVWGKTAFRHNDCRGSVQLDGGEWEECSCLCHRSLHYVNVYRLEQGYGGPEEGGWYYEAGEPVASVPFDTVREAEAEQEKLRERFPEGRNRYSVAPRGDDFGVYIEGHFAAPFPEHTPRYE
jgi:hypothetical protein